MQYSNPRLFIDSVEAYAGKTFRFKNDIVTILETAKQRNMIQSVGDIIFNAKFITQALNILRRVGPAHTDAVKLTNELKEMLEKTATLLRTVIKESPENVKAHFLKTFFSLTNDAMDNFTELLYELHWIKNYLLDQKKSP